MCCLLVRIAAVVAPSAASYAALVQNGSAANLQWGLMPLGGLFTMRSDIRGYSPSSRGLQQQCCTCRPTTFTPPPQTAELRTGTQTHCLFITMHLSTTTCVPSCDDGTELTLYPMCICVLFVYAAVLVLVRSCSHAHSRSSRSGRGDAARASSPALHRRRRRRHKAARALGPRARQKRRLQMVTTAHQASRLARDLTACV